MESSIQTNLFSQESNTSDSSDDSVCQIQENEEKETVISHHTMSLTNSKSLDPPKDQHNIVMYSGPKAAESEDRVKLVSQIFNESFGYRPDGKPYRLGPKSIRERLLSTDYLLIAGDETLGLGYLFGKEIPSTYGRISWIESMAVLPLYRRQGIATALVKMFFNSTKGAYYLGCATPNPIAAHIVTGVATGEVYIGACSPPRYIHKILREIQHNCFDLRGCLIDRVNMRIRTGFSPLSRSDQRQWTPHEPQDPPHWWSTIENLPNEFEALLVIKRETFNT